MKKMNLFASVLAGGVMFYSGLIIASDVETIQFRNGYVNHTWSGSIVRGEQRFSIWMKRGQQISVSGPDVYTWSLITKTGEIIGCDGNTYCSPSDQIWSLPYTGNYTVVTDYRMSDCASCRVSKTRDVIVTFEVY